MKLDDTGYQTLKSNFLAKVPSFRTFRESRQYIEQERAYKDDLCALFDQTVRPYLGVSSTEQRRLLGAGLLQILTKPLASSGRPQNIVGWRTLVALSDATSGPEGLDRFAAETNALLVGSDTLHARIQRFSKYVRSLKAKSGTSLTASETRRLGSFFLTLFDKNACVFIKTREFKELFRLFNTGYELNPSGLSADDIEHVVDLAQALLERLTAEGWQPADLIDVQGFIWTALHASHTENWFELVLKEGAIENGNLSIAKAPEGFFPADSYGGKDDDNPGANFKLVLPGGEEMSTDIRASGSSGRLRKRFRSVFQHNDVKPGQVARITRLGEREYALSFRRLSDEASASDAGEIAEVDSTNMSVAPMNQILFGPPGTGKTFHAVTAALEILDPALAKQHSSNRERLKERFDELVREGRVRVITFHQSYSYEDFVEGIRAVPDPANAAIIRYPIEDGVFTKICEAARIQSTGAGAIVGPDAKVWKLSIGKRQDVRIREECFRCGEARIGWGHVGDLSNEERPPSEIDALDNEGGNNQHSLRSFYADVSIGDIFLCLKSRTSIQAVGVVTGDYEFDRANEALWGDYFHKRAVRWLATDLDLDIRSLNDGAALTQKTIYQLNRIKPAEALRLAGPPQAGNNDTLPYVLIIDEINRGNVSKVFGELITLLEPSKRAGRPEVLEVTLPYSKRTFSVPPNVYVIGTMNTADRSLATLDIALRRRFEFIEKAPDPKELAGIKVPGIDVAAMLEVMNQRIEVLLDRDHALGHAYFIPLRTTPTFAHLAQIFRKQVLPLLQEYFFEDWERIRWVLNDHRKPNAEHQFVVRPSYQVAKLIGDFAGIPTEARQWRINDEAFAHPESFRGIISVE